MDYKKRNESSAKPKSTKGWILVKSKLPEIGCNVLMYHEIETVEEGISPFIEIGYLSQATNEEHITDLEWRDNEHNRLSSPVYWMPLPKLPVLSPTE